MENSLNFNPQNTARIVGAALLGTICVGIASAIFVSHNIDINMSGDVIVTAENMMEAELRLKAKAYIALLILALEVIVSIGFYLLLRKSGPLLAGWSLFVSFAASGLMLLGAMFAMNAAQIAGNPAYMTLASEQQRLLLTGLQATSDHASFHLGLILSSAANAGFFYLFLKSGLLPKLISGWGLFASIFVAGAIVLRDFIPAIGHDAVTAAFMLSNLVALISTGLYLGIKGVQNSR